MRLLRSLLALTLGVSLAAVQMPAFLDASPVGESSEARQAPGMSLTIQLTPGTSGSDRIAIPSISRGLAAPNPQLTSAAWGKDGLRGAFGIPTLDEIRRAKSESPVACSMPVCVIPAIVTTTVLDF